MYVERFYLSRDNIIFLETVLYFQKRCYISRTGLVFADTVLYFQKQFHFSRNRPWARRAIGPWAHWTLGPMGLLGHWVHGPVGPLDPWAPPGDPRAQAPLARGDFLVQGSSRPPEIFQIAYVFTKIKAKLMINSLKGLLFWFPFF